MNRVTLTDDQMQFFIDKQTEEIRKIKIELDHENDAKLALLDYVAFLGKEHILKCAKLILEKYNLDVYKTATGYWHDTLVDLSILNELINDEKYHYESWSDEELKGELK